MAQRRFCPKCKQEHLHDKVIEHMPGVRFSGFGRIAVAVATLGVSELDRDVLWKCQACGHQQNINC
jgi:hypothetical protein